MYISYTGYSILWVDGLTLGKLCFERLHVLSTNGTGYSTYGRFPMPPLTLDSLFLMLGVGTTAMYRALNVALGVLTLGIAERVMHIYVTLG